MATRTAPAVRAKREALGLSQAALAERVSVSRQALGAIEAGRATPGVDVAIALARALECTVEELFEEPAPARITIASGPGATLGRAALARVGRRWIAHALSESGLTRSADVVLRRRSTGRVSIEPLRPRHEAAENLVLVGCAPALGLLADRLNSRQGPGRFLWISRSSSDALQALSRREVHVAGVHLVDPRTGVANVTQIRSAAVERTAIVTLAQWEAGIVQRPGARSIRSLGDLRKSELKLVARERGSGARALLERELRAVGDERPLSAWAHLTVGAHADVARAVTQGVADVGVASMDVARAFGLRFVPLARERFDLAIPRALLSDPRISRMLDELCSEGMRRELASLGYDASDAGNRVAEVDAA